MRTTWVDLDRGQRIGSRVRDRQPIRGVRSSLMIWCKGVQALAPPGSRKKVWDKKESPLWVYVSPSISQTNNCGPFLRIKWEIYFYHKKCLVHLFSLIMFLIVNKDTAEYTTLNLIWSPSMRLSWSIYESFSANLHIYQGKMKENLMLWKCTNIKKTQKTKSSKNDFIYS